MGEMKHTPGPWAFNDDDGTINAQGGVVADVNCSDFTLRRDEHNARLIAAAPDMRDALIAARQQLVTLGGDLPDDPTGIIHGDPIQAAVLTVIDAALSKAEGRSLSSASGQEGRDHG